MPPTTHHPINFGPLATNVLDCVDRSDLRTPEGQPVSVRHPAGRGFTVTIGDQVYRDLDNLAASYALNLHAVGVMA